MRVQTVPMPEAGQEPWPWVAGVAVMGVVALFGWIMKIRGEQIADLKEAGKTCATDLRLTTDALKANTDSLERQRVSHAEGLTALERRQAERDAATDRRLERIEAAVMGWLDRRGARS